MVCHLQPEHLGPQQMVMFDTWPWGFGLILSLACDQTNLTSSSCRLPEDGPFQHTRPSSSQAEPQPDPARTSSS